MQILSLKSIDSTQRYLKELLLRKSVEPPYAVITDTQTQGVGSRGNRWESLDGNLFVSFCLSLDALPTDLKVESASIYFSYMLKELLEELGSKVWLKWPNDFYVDDLKIGGAITNIVRNNIVCGFGVNIKKAPAGFGKLDIEIDKFLLLKLYFENLEKKVLWKQVFSKYKLEFARNNKFYTHIEKRKVNLREALLESDGSLNINGERIYSLR